FPCNLTKTFPRLPSMEATTYSWITRLPAFIFEHIGSMPMRMMGLPGSFPVRRTWPLIVPVCAWPNAFQANRQTHNRSTTRHLIFSQSPPFCFAQRDGNGTQEAQKVLPCAFCAPFLFRLAKPSRRFSSG